MVEGVEDLGARLVDGEEDTGSGIRDLLQDTAKLNRGEAVQSRCGFVQEHESRLGHQLHSDGCALALPAADPLDQRTSNDGIGAVLQSELGQHAVGEELDLLVSGGSRQTKASREADRLPWRGRDLEGVILGDEGDLLAHLDIGWIDPVVVKPDVGGDGDATTGSGTSSQDVEEGCLSGATWSHDGSGLLCRNLSPHVVEELAILLSFLPLEDHVDAGPCEGLACALSEWISVEIWLALHGDFGCSIFDIFDVVLGGRHGDQR
mmetsp:Transcript_10268/g.28208  ORF Transcript_10268/g.28208 Transcript_10268/m.28208 type:complete len:263 (+) Transcript_10268:481-1269(+)